jgi:hypothetical protein
MPRIDQAKRSKEKDLMKKQLGFFELACADPLELVISSYN